MLMFLNTYTTLFQEYYPLDKITPHGQKEEVKKTNPKRRRTNKVIGQWRGGTMIALSTLYLLCATMIAEAVGALYSLCATLIALKLWVLSTRYVLH